MSARILVIEDNPTNLDLMVYLLNAFGYTTEKVVPVGQLSLLFACDGEAGMTAAYRDAPDLIICDIQLPKTDGFEVARRLKNHPAQSAIPIVAVTALAMVGDRDQVLTAGFDGYIAKPIAPETFIEQVEAFLRPDQRSTFQPSNVSTTVETPSPPLSRHAAILAVDDSSVNITLLRSILEPFGYEVVAADTVEKRIALARRNPPDLIISDVHLAMGADMSSKRLSEPTPG